MIVFSCCKILTVVVSPSVRVDPELTAYLRGEVTLHCHLIRGDLDVNATQVEWRKDKGATALAVFHPVFGKSYLKSPLEGRVKFISDSVDDASIIITNVSKTDEGTYTCEYILHLGNEEASTILTLMADRPWPGSAAEVSGLVTALLVVILLAAAVYFIMMKRRQRRDAPTDHSSHSSSNQATRVTGREDEDVNYADIRHLRPALASAAASTSEADMVYAEVKHNSQPSTQPPHTGGGRDEGDVTYAQVNRK
ncbi:hypothetical protein SKAU_G00223400 [Synaphobranchus kaupii]|uniref:Ig-like domain-containing protein n=1 Tax=Synaphobranchus kaupii TaxID=118154 RepID=A0A9Q1FB70_SYNKA|nr:hypothetical protein SKAU_G00223400 [Synaphobranchus kaupii]